MQIIQSVSQLHQYLSAQEAIQSIGFVPTMGNLHAGHLSLVSAAKKYHDFVVVSIYVNRKQFNQQSDFENYPNTFDDDVKKLTAQGVNILFAPNENEMYPEGIEQSTSVAEPSLTHVLCGATRLGHFEGVTTIVAKFLNIIQPDTLYLGEKDYQQYLVLKKMVSDLFIPCQVEVVPTSREATGLAMSSRNNLLSEADKAKTAHFRRPLTLLKDQLIKDASHLNEKIDATKQAMTQKGFKIDYLACLHNQDLSQYDGTKDIRQYRLFIAAFLGDVRLIDNIQIV